VVGKIIEFRSRVYIDLLRRIWRVLYINRNGIRRTHDRKPVITCHSEPKYNQNKIVVVHCEATKLKLKLLLTT